MVRVGVLTIGYMNAHSNTKANRYMHGSCSEEKEYSPCTLTKNTRRIQKITKVSLAILDQQLTSHCPTIAGSVPTEFLWTKDCLASCT